MEQFLMPAVILYCKEDVLFIELLRGIFQAGGVAGCNCNSVPTHDPAVLAVVQGRKINAPVQEVKASRLEGTMDVGEVADQLVSVVYVERAQHDVDKVHRRFKPEVDKVGQVKLGLNLVCFRLALGKLKHGWT